MISIIVCSIKPTWLENFKNNVEQTIKMPFELIAIDNWNTTKGICKVYNDGLAQAKYDIVCFCHEDIVFNTQDWGKELGRLLTKDAELGLVGVCGATYKSSYPSPWVSVPSQYYRSNLLQQNAEGSRVGKPVLDNGDFSEVVVLDGCFIAGRKEVFAKYKWNDELLKGFHLYDVDLCIRVSEHCKLGVAK